MESECRMQRRKPLGEKILEKIRGNPALPSEKKFQLFLNSHQRKPRLFSKPKTAPKLQFSVFFFKKKRKKQTRIKRKRGWNPLY